MHSSGEAWYVETSLHSIRLDTLSEARHVERKACGMFAITGFCRGVRPLDKDFERPREEVNSNRPEGMCIHHHRTS